MPGYPRRTDTVTTGQGAALRFAILCQEEPLDRWQVRCVEYLLAAGGAEPVAVIVARGKGPPPRPPRSLARAYVGRARRQLHDPVELASVAGHLPRLHVRSVAGPGGGELSELDLATVRRLGLDFVLSLGADPLAGTILEIPRYGVWAFDFDRHWTGRVGLGEVPRAVAGRTVTEVALLRLTSVPARAAILKEGFFRSDGRNPFRELARARERCARWPASVCAALRRGQPAPSDVWARPPAASVPGSTVMLRLAALLLLGRLRVAWGRLFRHPQWNIGIVDQPIHEFLGGDDSPPVRWFPQSGRRGFLADPFGVGSADEAMILCEHFDYRTAKGTIRRLDVSGGRFGSAPQAALELPVHLSYPFLVEDEGALFCVPETGQSREVTLFEADRGGHGWSKVGTLVDGVPAADPTVFRHAGRWWLAATDGDTAADEDLLLWHAPALGGPWTAHPGNPVKTDVRSARPAGTPFEHDGVLYRPAQDCSSGYGARIVINRVGRLTTQEFAEEPVAAIEPPPGSAYPAGRHTLSALGDATLIDGHRFVFVGSALSHFLRIWARALTENVSGAVTRGRRGGGREGGGDPFAPPPRSGF